ncbi:MAG: hypothetical protein LAE24_00255 [Candidatus Contendobacter sp.]|nr:hypothetical protein [Candidatus Contendobacter sp.]
MNTLNTLENCINVLGQRNCKPVKSGDGYLAYCPSHEGDGQGHHPSLSIKSGDTVPVILHCHAGCDPVEILKTLGLNAPPHSGKSHIAATYQFQDAHGIVVFEKVRREPKDFRVRHQALQGGDWIWKKPELPSYPLYRLPELLKAKADGHPICVMEGEKDVDRLTPLGLVATTNFEGASEKGKKAKWRPEYTEQLAGANRIYLFPDNDAPGRAHMLNIARQLRGKVPDVRWVELPGLPAKGDVSDWLNQGHNVAELLAMMEKAPTADSVTAPADPPLEEEEEEEERPVGPARPATVYVVVGELPEATDQAETALIQHGAGLYQRSGYLCRISHLQAATVRGITRPHGAVTISQLDRDSLLDQLNRFIHFKKWNEKEKSYKRCHAPAAIAQTLLARSGSWHFPPLIGVVSAPTLRPDGSILDQPGYDKTTGLFFDAQNEVFPPIPADPSPEDGRAALQFLKDELFNRPCLNSERPEDQGFSFAKDSDRSAALSATLTGLVRPSLPTAPIFLATATRPGSAKTLLMDVPALVATGRPATIFELGADADEVEKRMLSVLLAGDSVINLDNLDIPLAGATLCKTLSGETITGRLLGFNKTATVATAALFLATGNNVQVHGDMTRRVVICNLDPRSEAPESRQYDRNLATWIPANRGRLVQAGLTVLRSYIAAGRPAQPYPPMGSFEDWDQMVRRALTWLGESDPLAGTAELNDSDPVRKKLRALLIAWSTTFQSAGATSKEAVARAQEVQRDQNSDETRPAQALWDVLEESFTDKQGKISSRYVGEFLKKYAGRMEIGTRFEIAGNYGTRVLWRVVIVDEKRFQNFLAGSKSTAQTAQTAQTIHVEGLQSLQSVQSLSPHSANYGAAVSSSPLAIRIVATLQAVGPGGMNQDDLIRTVDIGKTGAPMVLAEINRMLLAGEIVRVNGRLAVNPVRH